MFSAEATAAVAAIRVFNMILKLQGKNKDVEKQDAWYGTGLFPLFLLRPPHKLIPSPQPWLPLRPPRHSYKFGFGITHLLRKENLGTASAIPPIQTLPTPLEGGEGEVKATTRPDYAGR